MNPLSVASWESLHPLHQNRCYQKIIAVVVDHPKTREEIERETGLRGNTVRPRVVELINAGILMPQGEGRTMSGRRAEKIGLNTLWHTSAGTSSETFSRQRVGGYPPTLPTTTYLPTTLPTYPTH